MKIHTWLSQFVAVVGDVYDEHEIEGMISTFQIYRSWANFESEMLLHC
jgi:hypothetical protein